MRARGTAPAPQARVLERLGEFSHLAGIDYATGISCLEQALELYVDLGQVEGVARVHARLGRALSTLPETWDLPRAVEHYQQAEAMLSSAGVEDALLGWVYVGLAQVGVWDVRVEQGLRASARALEIAEGVHDEGGCGQHIRGYHARRSSRIRRAHLRGSATNAPRLARGGPSQRSRRVLRRLPRQHAFASPDRGSVCRQAQPVVRSASWRGRASARRRPARTDAFKAALAAGRALGGDMPAARTLALVVGPRTTPGKCCSGRATGKPARRWPTSASPPVGAAASAPLRSRPRSTWRGCCAPSRGSCSAARALLGGSTRGPHLTVPSRPTPSRCAPLPGAACHVRGGRRRGRRPEGMSTTAHAEVSAMATTGAGWRVRCSSPTP